MSEYQPTQFCIKCNYPIDHSRSLYCPECGQPFDPNDPASYNVGLQEAVKLYPARDSMEAHFVRSLLLENGIPAQVLGDVLGNARGELPPTIETLPAVWVTGTDVPPAMKVINEYQRVNRDGADEPGEPWTCQACGEEVGGQFGMCWNCEGERPED